MDGVHPKRIVVLATAAAAAGAALMVPMWSSAHAQPTVTGEAWSAFQHRVNYSDKTVAVTYYRTQQAVRTPEGAWRHISATLRQASADEVISSESARPFSFHRAGQLNQVVVQLAQANGLAFGAPSLRGVAPVLARNTVRYNDVAADTDLVYEVAPAAIKETFRLRSPSAPRSFAFVLSSPASLGELVQDGKGGYYFNKPTSDGLLVSLVAPAAYFLRSGVREPFAAHLSARRNADGTYSITLALDGVPRSDQYPIFLDPIVELTTATDQSPAFVLQAISPTGGCTTQVANGCDLQWANLPRLSVYEAYGAVYRGFVKFALTPPLGMRVADAQLSLPPYDTQSSLRLTIPRTAIRSP